MVAMCYAQRQVTLANASFSQSRPPQHIATILKHTAESNRLLRRLTRRSVPTRSVNSSTFADLLSLTDQRMCFNMVRDIATTLPYVPVFLKSSGSLDSKPARTLKLSRPVT